MPPHPPSLCNPRIIPREPTMKSHRPVFASLPFLLVLAALAGCSASKTTTSDAEKKKTDSTAAAPAEKAPVAEEPKSADKPFKLGDGIKPFTPPALAELDKTAQWVDGPIVD